jgi:hypothetical protein
MLRYDVKTVLPAPAIVAASMLVGYLEQRSAV